MMDAEIARLRIDLDAMSERAGKASRMIESLEGQLEQARKESVGRDRQLNELLHFQNALVEAAEMPADLTPEQILPWFIERLCSADAGDYESAMGPARAEAMRVVIAQRDQAQKDAKDARALLGEIDDWKDLLPGYLRARIEAMLEQKP